MKAVVEFLRQLHAHNERAWCEAHRAEWLQVQERVRSFAERLIEGIASFDPSVEGLTAKDCTYRIYRDVRFSRDKSPYKTWQGIYVAPHGKKAGYAGYYFHLEGAAEEGLVGSHMLFSGLHMRIPRCSEAYARRFRTMARNLSGTSGAPKDSRSTSRSD